MWCSFPPRSHVNGWRCFCSTDTCPAEGSTATRELNIMQHVHRGQGGWWIVFYLPACFNLIFKCTAVTAPIQYVMLLYP